MKLTLHVDNQDLAVELAGNSLMIDGYEVMCWNVDSNFDDWKIGKDYDAFQNAQLRSLTYISRLCTFLRANREI